MTQHAPLRRALPVLLALVAGPFLAAAPAPVWLAAAQAANPKPVQPDYATPDAAVAALVDAARKDDAKALRAILGPGSGKLVDSGDPVADAKNRADFVARYDEKHALNPDNLGRMVLTIGANDWPVPMPLDKVDGRWRFDSRAGAEAIVDRRIGENEIAAIRTALAYVDAQKVFFEETGGANGGEYAQHLASTEGQRDGLFWEGDDGQPDGPLGPLVAQARDEGYPGGTVDGKPQPYQGYFFRILTAQGYNAPGGKLDYMQDGHMTKGFALVAWPARYRASGVMTFVVNQDGVVFQKDLGKTTAEIAAAMTKFDPDLSWARVDIVQE